MRHNGRFLGTFLGFAEEGYEASPGHIGFVFSDDLRHWQKYPEPLIDIGPEGTFDSIHAHKPSVIMKDGILYHFYCSVGPRSGQEGRPWPYNEHRAIAVATSWPL